MNSSIETAVSGRNKEFVVNEETSISPYVVRFTLVYVVTLIAVAAVLTAQGVEAESGTSMAALVVAVAFTVSKFVKAQRRVPTPSERKKLTWLSLAASFTVSLVLGLAFLAVMSQLSLIAQTPGLLAPFSGGLVVGVLLFITALGSEKQGR